VVTETPAGGTSAPDATLVVPTAVEFPELRRKLRSLIAVEPTEALVVSCYTSFDHGPLRLEYLDRRARTIRGSLVRGQREAFDDAMLLVRAQLAQRSPAARGMAVFARTGAAPLLDSIELGVPLPELLTADLAPIVYPLIELRDTFHRFVVLIVSERSARIVEVTLGAVTRDLRSVASRAHYQNHRRDRADQFHLEKLAVLEQLIVASGHTHLILAGSPALTERLRERLPPRLRARLIDSVPASASDAPADVVQAALASFIAREEAESFDAAEALCREVRRGGLAEIGTMPTIEALQRGQADLLVMTGTYAPGAGLVCSLCGTAASQPGPLGACALCGGGLDTVDLREQLVRLAERTGCGFERVAHHEPLSDLGGVGCLLRYATPGH
jgi:hypothetical protein